MGWFEEAAGWTVRLSVASEDSEEENHGRTGTEGEGEEKISSPPDSHAITPSRESPVPVRNPSWSHSRLGSQPDVRLTPLSTSLSPLSRPRREIDLRSLFTSSPPRLTKLRKLSEKPEKWRRRYWALQNPPNGDNIDNLTFRAVWRIYITTRNSWCDKSEQI